jgi:dTDP-4-amino-4,6-dideoxygalactose transaminase
VFDELRANGIGVNLHYIPVYLQPYYQSMGFNPDDFVQAQRYYQEAISLPMFSSMTQHMQDKVADVLTQVLAGVK